MRRPCVFSDWIYTGLAQMSEWLLIGLRMALHATVNIWLVSYLSLAATALVLFFFNGCMKCGTQNLAPFVLQEEIGSTRDDSCVDYWPPVQVVWIHGIWVCCLCQWTNGDIYQQSLHVLIFIVKVLFLTPTILSPVLTNSFSTFNVDNAWMQRATDFFPKSYKSFVPGLNKTGWENSIDIPSGCVYHCAG